MTIDGVEIYICKCKGCFLAQAEERSSLDNISWEFGFRGTIPENSAKGIRRHSVFKYWLVTPQENTRESAIEALVIQAKRFGFNKLEIFEISPPLTRYLRELIGEINQKRNRFSIVA